MWNNPNVFNAELYRDGRPDYPKELIACIKSFLQSEINSENEKENQSVVFNIGCGPGKGSIPLSYYFSQVYSSDSSDLQLSAAPILPKVKYEKLAAEDLMNYYTAESADVCFLGLSLHIIGVEMGTKCAKYLLKTSQPSLMAVAGYHFGYIIDPAHIPDHILNYFSNQTSGDNQINLGGVSNNLIFCENITDSYPNHLKKTLFMKKHYPYLKEACDYLDKPVAYFKNLEVSKKRNMEFSEDEIEFQYKKKIYFHIIEKTCIKDLFLNVKAYEHMVEDSYMENFKTYREEFVGVMKNILNLKSDDETFYNGRIFYTILCSDNIKLS